MKRIKVFLIVYLIIIVFSGCSKEVPSIKTVYENGIDWANEEFKKYTLDDFINSWGEPSDTWETEETEDFPIENGYLWLTDDNKIEVIIYFTNDNTISTIAINENKAIND